MCSIKPPTQRLGDGWHIDADAGNGIKGGLALGSVGGHDKMCHTYRGDSVALGSATEGEQLCTKRGGRGGEEGRDHTCACTAD